MNNYSKLLRQSLDELDEWLLQRTNLNPNDDRLFYERVKYLLREAVDSEPQNVDSIIETILYTITDSGPNDMLRDDFLPSLSQVVVAVQKKKKEG